MVVVAGDLAHLVRCDREAVFFTPSFQYKAHPKALVSFFSRFATMSPRQRGFDPTPTVLTPGDPRRRLMQDMARSNLASRGPQAEYARQCFENALDPAWPWYSIPVDGREFLVGKPHVYMEPLLGRPSRGYVALRVDQDCYAEGEGSPFVWLKDTWRRVRNSEYEREGSIIGDLNRCGVRGVPTLICHEDVLDHKINFFETADRLYGRVPDPTRPHIELIQYRMVVKEVGVPVEEFRDGKELVEIVLDCVTAHRDAYQLAGVLHRDISPGNLLMVHTEGLGDGDIVFQGILNDWELAERIARRVEPGFLYQPRRRGTWEFLSLFAMNHPEYPVQPEDDVESFVHVLLSFAIAYLPHNCDNLHDFDSAYFFCEKTNNGSVASALKRRCLTSGRLYLAKEGADTLIFLTPDEMDGGHIHSRTLGHPMNDVFQMLLSWTRSRYAVETGRSPGIARPHAVLSSSREAKENVNTHEGVGSTLLQKTATAVRRLVSPLSHSQRRSNEHTMPTQGFERDGIKFDAHDAMTKILSAAIAHDLWPLEDKTADQLES
ncbi:hypothetical protein C8Q74DRAFT_931320 [Fomes fomentarius]|nr:hypothetical protein C8Q74DRAFT_931320 [Fomes fomentarius]